MSNTEAKTDSTPMDDSVASGGQTEEALLADILKNTDFLSSEESLPDEQIPEVDTDDSNEDEPEALEEDDTEEVEEEVEDEEEDIADEDDESTQEAEIFSTGRS